jgi:hypothetical protein
VFDRRKNDTNIDILCMIISISFIASIEYQFCQKRNKAYTKNEGWVFSFFYILVDFDSYCRTIKFVQYASLKLFFAFLVPSFPAARLAPSRPATTSGHVCSYSYILTIVLIFCVEHEFFTILKKDLLFIHYFFIC